MSEEWFDTVDDGDRVIGRGTRKEVHRKGLKHRAIHILICNHAGQVFLQKRSRMKDNFPGLWDSSVSGHLHRGEDYDKAAEREMREELGLRSEVSPRRLFKIDACAETGEEFVWVYHLAHEGPFSLPPEEIEEGGWFAPEEVRRWMESKPGDFAGAFRLIWMRYLGENKP